MANREYDILVIGGGHAGAEAAWAASRLGAQTALITLDEKKIGQMSCNPAIGGLAKGQMVREVDALGGLMGIATDNTGIQFRMLNRSKGPAVWGPRAQADKYKYAAEVQRLLRTCPNLDIIRGEVAEIETDRQQIRGVVLADGAHLHCRAVIITTGTFLRALMHTGEKQTEGGRVGEPAARGLSSSLQKLGLELGRLKTGTPPRLHRDSIDFSKFEPQPGDEIPLPFSYLNEYPRTHGEAMGFEWKPPLTQIACHLGATNAQIHDIIRANLHRAPMYSGQIQSTGPRYCPSIEDKVVRFADKQQHHIFLEPEGLDTDEIYCNGISTSLPADVQEQIVRLVPGLENAKFLRHGYAVEYDMVWPTQIRATLETKAIKGLFLAGQINGTSGYEEAAAQGMMAGINAAQYAACGLASFVLRRDQAYIGVLIDDLVTKPPTEPYRMFTSRAEHRLHLRNDNADERLTAVGREIHLVDDDRWSRFVLRRDAIASGLEILKNLRVEGTAAPDWLRRSENDWQKLAALSPAAAAIAPDIARQLEIQMKYAGYIARQDKQIERFAKMENKLIPNSLDYASVTGLRNEARQKLSKFTPRSLGQALRISGITPADITLLAVHLDRRSN
ncbi:MAG TPA: tRNA uridine-5-carboxymethylaminomethyl(34) synthesis enzyme MnmG [Tepidisphaeraceae bacterium]|nr:tRNA uridine-5-carboxymethylaminomethyl(34) synthesis enzyme MnmG [Tepidisphaeraceae bacterium]